MKKFYVDGKKIWIDRQDAKIIAKSLLCDPTISVSARKRLRKELYDSIIKPLYSYEVKCNECGCELQVVYDKKLTQEEVEKKCRYKDTTFGDMGIICGRCMEDYK